MVKSIRQNAETILSTLAAMPNDDWRPREVTGEELQNLTGLTPPEINDAVSILERNDYVEMLQESGTKPYNFNIVIIKPEGRFEFERMSEEKPNEESSNVIKDSTKVFVVHGRNELARKAIFDFLRSINLKPIEWSEAVALTGQSSPVIGEVLDKAICEAQAVLVVLTGDDLARLGTRYADFNEGYEKLSPQARPNVLFEAGMALGRYPDRTILIQLGDVRPFSDIAGRLVINLNNSPVKRQELVSRLSIAGCRIDITHKKDWLAVGDFEACILWPDIEIESKDTKAASLETTETKLNETQVSILKFLAEAFDRNLHAGHRKVMNIAHSLSLPATKVAYNAEALIKNNFLNKECFGSGEEYYEITKSGMAYLYENSLV